jgi:hypothetical protein
LTEEDFAPRTDALRQDLLRRMAAWARPLLDRLHDAGVPVRAQLHAAEAQAVLRLVFSGEAQSLGGSDERRGLPPVVLTLSLSAERVRAGLELPAPRARSVRAALASPELALELIAAFEALPEQFEVAVDGDSAPIQAPRCTVDDLRTLLDRSAAADRPLWIGWTVPRAIAVHHSSLLDEQLTDSLVVLARVHALLGGDAGAVQVRARPERAADRKKRGARRAEDDRDRNKRWPRDAALHEATQERARDRRSTSGGGGGARQDAEAEAEPDVDRSVARVLDARLPARVGFKSARGKGGAATSRRRHDVVERGAQVRVLEGPFAGKVGVVHELDGHGGARVMMGLLAVRIDVANLEVHVEGLRRPVLSTSHRKPVPARS